MIKCQKEQRTTAVGGKGSGTVSGCQGQRTLPSSIANGDVQDLNTEQRGAYSKDARTGTVGLSITGQGSGPLWPAWDAKLIALLGQSPRITQSETRRHLRVTGLTLSFCTQVDQGR